MMPITAFLVRDKSGTRGRSVLPGSPRQKAFPRRFPPSFGPVHDRPVLKWSAPDGVLDLRTGLPHVALGPVTAAPGAQAPVAGEPAGGPLEAAFGRFGFVRELLADTHGTGFRGVILRAREHRQGRRARALRPGRRGPA